MDSRRAGRYERIYQQLHELTRASPSPTAVMATICAVLHAKMPHHSWTGFYLVHDADELHVGPYQGPVACQVLRGQGVCLHAVQTRSAVVVADVDAFPGHITCDDRSRSEIVVPILFHGNVVAVLDVDAVETDAFTEADIEPLTRIVSLLAPHL